MLNLSKKSAITILAGILYVGGAWFGLPMKTLAMTNASQIPAIVFPAEAPKNNAFAQWLNRLEKIESRDSGDAHFKIMDNNNEYSYGCLQFQAATFLQYGKQYNLIPQELTDVEPLIYDCSLQKELATAMIEGNYKNWQNWRHSVREVVGLPPRPQETLAESQQTMLFTDTLTIPVRAFANACPAFTYTIGASTGIGSENSRG